MENAKLTISVVLPNYNGKRLLERNLPPLIEALSGIDSEVIVVDDASTDDSVLFLQRTFPSVIQLKNPKNQGFSPTCNRGIDVARGELTCVSNTDVTFPSEYFRVVISAMTNENLFAVKGPIVNHRGDVSDPTNVDTTAILFSKRGFIRFDKTEDHRPGLMSAQMGERFALLGCCFTARTRQLQEIGGFDCLFAPFYWEDSDLPIRAERLGYRVRYVPEARVFHEQGATIDRAHKRYWRKLVSDRNKFLFAWRHYYKVSDWVRHVAFVAVSITVRWIRLDLGYYVALSWALAITVVGRHHIRLDRRNTPLPKQRN